MRHSESQRCAQLTLSSLVPTASGLKRPTRKIQPIIINARMIPGTMPAMNSRPTDSLATRPYRISPTVGGISSAKPPAEATQPVARRLS